MQFDGTGFECVGIHTNLSDSGAKCTVESYSYTLPVADISIYGFSFVFCFFVVLQFSLNHQTGHSSIVDIPVESQAQETVAR